MSYVADSLGNMGAAEERRVAMQRQEVVSTAESNSYGKHAERVCELTTLMSDQQDKVFHYTEKSLDYKNREGEE